MMKNFTNFFPAQLFTKSTGMHSITSQVWKKTLNKICVVIFYLLVFLPSAFSQDFMMQGWYWDCPKPGCNSCAGPSIAEDMRARAEAQKNAGFTMMWMPPLAKASFGNCSNGYDWKYQIQNSFVLKH